MYNSKDSIEELWDYICVNIGFDEKGKDLQGAIKKYVELKSTQKEAKWETREEWGARKDW